MNGELRARVLRALSDGDTPDSDLREFSLWLESGGLAELLRDVVEVRRILNGEPDRGDESPQDQSKAAHEQEITDSEMLRQVERLLLREAALGAAEAIALLVRELDYTGSLPTRKSFTYTVGRIARDIGWSRVLAAAQRVSRKRVDESAGRPRRSFEGVPTRSRPAEPRNAASSESPAIAQVEGLLLNEAALSAAEATLLLVRALGYGELLPKRKSFSYTVSRIGRDVGWSRLLAAAQRVRNDRVHQQPPAWSSLPRSVAE